LRPPNYCKQLHRELDILTAYTAKYQTNLESLLKLKELAMLPEYLLFVAKIATIVVAILILLLGIVIILSKGKPEHKEVIKVKKINDKFEEITQKLREEILSKHNLKKLLKAEKQAAKAAKKASSQEQHTTDDQSAEQEQAEKRLFVVHFNGDIRASAVKNLREEITAILTIATSNDEVVICLESPGGMVHAYGLASSQLKRIRKQNIPLTVIVDKVAASGGYMMACVANRIIAAPFAIIGSIGVIAQIPNFNRLLKKKDIDFEQITGGQYKRTLTMFGKNTKEGREKFQEEINETHELFKTFVIENRPKLDINAVSTGEHWFGAKALELNLIDEIMTSDDYLLNASQDAEIFEIKHISAKKGLMDRIGHSAQQAFEQVFQKLSS
jgi:serine protease SohB